jgi:D-arabinose 1-dehydrogenase-like Zn-dependent alcohol dehydrogenase
MADQLVYNEELSNGHASSNEPSESAAQLDSDESRRVSRPGDTALKDRTIPKAGPEKAIIKARLTTICGTDIQVLRTAWEPAPNGVES